MRKICTGRAVACAGENFELAAQSGFLGLLYNAAVAVDEADRIGR